MICGEVDQKLLATGQITMFWVDEHPFKWPWKDQEHESREKMVDLWFQKEEDGEVF